MMLLEEARIRHKSNTLMILDIPFDLRLAVPLAQENQSQEFLQSLRSARYLRLLRDLAAPLHGICWANQAQ